MRYDSLCPVHRDSDHSTVGSQHGAQEHTVCVCGRTSGVFLELRECLKEEGSGLSGLYDTVFTPEGVFDLIVVTSEELL